MQYDNTNSGALFKNDRKDTDRHPDYRGDANINGKDVWVAAWIREGKNGKKFMSLSFTEKGYEQKQKQKPVPVNDNVNALEDVPF